MAIRDGEFKSFVGVKNLNIALVTQDDSGGYVAGTPQRLSFTAELSAEPAVESKTQYADNQPFENAVVEGETPIKVNITNLPAELAALISGKTFDATTGRVYDHPATPPYIALGFEAEKSNGKSRFYWFLKGRFTVPTEAFATKTESIEFKQTELTYTAIPTIHEFTVASGVNRPVKRVWGDGDTDSFNEANWFAQVQVPGVASVAALALSTAVPAADATGVAVSANVVLTFNNALQTGEEFDCRLLTAAGVSIACATTIDAARKVVTLDPNANLSAGVHIVSYAVKDIYGQTLFGSHKFTV